MSQAVYSQARETRVSLHLKMSSRSFAENVALAQRAEEAGLEAVYGIEILQDPFVPLTGMAAGTSTIRLGTYVANAYARSPQAAASSARQIDELSGGRFTLGVAAGNPHVNEWAFGVDSTRPMAKMRDYLSILRAELQGDIPATPEVGGPIHHMQSRYVRPPARPVPIIVAAAGPRMIDLAAATSDGVGLGILIGADHVASQLRPRAEAAALAAGRDPEKLRVLMSVLVDIDEDAERARSRTRQHIAGLFAPIPHPYYDHLLREQGYATVVEALTELAPQGRWHDAMAQISDDLLDRLTISGDPDNCARRLRSYFGVVDELVCMPRNADNQESPGPDSFERFFEICQPSKAS